MKRVVGIALGMTLGATVLQAGGSIGGFGNGMYYDAAQHTLYTHGKLAERFAILRQGANSDSTLLVYAMAPTEFDRLQTAADSRLIISAKSDSNATRSYRVYAEDDREMEFIDRRAAIRSGVTQ